MIGSTLLTNNISSYEWSHGSIVDNVGLYVPNVDNVPNGWLDKTA